MTSAGKKRSVYLIQPTKDPASKWNWFESAVVVAYDEEDAKNFHPNGTHYAVNGVFYPFCCTPVADDGDYSVELTEEINLYSPMKYCPSTSIWIDPSRLDANVKVTDITKQEKRGVVFSSFRLGGH